VGRDWRPTFLSIFRQTGIVALACRAAGISRTQAYRERQRNLPFAAEWGDAGIAATETLEAEARRRAMSTSDTLLILLLKARKPDVYRENIRIDIRREAEALKALALGALRLRARREAQRRATESAVRPHPIRDLTGQPIAVIAEAVLAAMVAAHPEHAPEQGPCASCIALIDLASHYGDPTHLEGPDPVRRYLADLIDGERKRLKT
jgi:hypothetical protein